MQTHSMDFGFPDDQHINVTLHITLTGISTLHLCPEARHWSVEVKH